MTDPENLRDAVRAYLKALPGSQRDLARELGVSYSWLNKFLCARITNPTMARLSHLSKWVERNKWG